jgi:hypothetical protein
MTTIIDFPVTDSRASLRTRKPSTIPAVTGIASGSQMETILIRLLEIERMSARAFSLVDGYIHGAHTAAQVMTRRG